MDLVKGQYDAHRPVAASAVRSGQKDSTWLGALSTGEDAHHHQVAASVDLDGEQCADKGAGSDQGGVVATPSPGWQERGQGRNDLAGLKESWPPGLRA